MSAAKPRAPKETKLVAMTIPVADITPGTVIVTKQAPRTGKVLGVKTLTRNDFAACESQRRTHIHIDGGCYHKHLGKIVVAVETLTPVGV